VPPIAAEILTLCQSQLTVREIVQEFCSLRTGKLDAPEELSLEEVCRYALRSLHRDKLIRFVTASP
jgi:hypothetical protein